MKDKLKQYLTHGYYDKKSAIIHKLLGKISQNFIAVPTANPKVNLQTIHETKAIYCPKYNLQNVTAHLLTNYLCLNNHEAIESAVVVGSIADNTEVNYSDFDGILIIDQEKCNETNSARELRRIIKESNQIMKTQDILQHHGWMILWKHNLLNYNENYLPSSIFENAKTLYPNCDTIINIETIKTVNDHRKIQIICQSIDLKIQNSKKHKDFYFLKNLISELLLAPAIYLQSKKGIYCSKRESFIEIKKHISEESLATLNTIELFRIQWNQDIAKSKFETPKEYLVWLQNNQKQIQAYINELKTN